MNKTEYPISNTQYPLTNDLHLLEPGIWNLESHKTQMGTIIADSSHFVALHRDVVQRQATVILAGFPSLISAFRPLFRKCCPGLPFRMCYHPDFRRSVVLPLKLLPPEVLADGAPL